MFCKSSFAAKILKLLVIYPTYKVPTITAIFPHNVILYYYISIFSTKWLSYLEEEIKKQA